MFQGLKLGRDWSWKFCCVMIAALLSSCQSAPASKREFEYRCLEYCDLKYLTYRECVKSCDRMKPESKEEFEEAGFSR